MGDRLEIHDSIYASRIRVVRFYGEHEALGSYERIGDQYLACFRRKPVATETEAILQVLDSEERGLRKRAERIARKRASIVAGEAL